MKQRLRDRVEAGRLLAKTLTDYADRPDVLVLGLPRGGVPVAYEIAQALHVPLDVCLVRKLGVPRQKELAMGAIGPGGVMVLNNEILSAMNIEQSMIWEIVAIEKQELERRDALYRGQRPQPNLVNRTVILVDDGIATSATLRAAIATLRQQTPQAIVVAVPVAAVSACQALKPLVDRIVCLMTPTPLSSIGQWYDDFSQTSDEEVCRLLEQSNYSFS